MDAFKEALQGDPISSYGGILGFNSEIKENAAKEIIKSFFEIIVAPDFNKRSLEILKSKKNLRIIKSKFENTKDIYLKSYLLFLSKVQLLPHLYINLFKLLLFFKY